MPQPLISGTRTHYLNAEFDLSLRARPRPFQPRLDRQVRELSAQALLGAEDGDAVLLRTEIAEEFIDHLATAGAAIPRVLAHPEIDPDSQLRPFGWSAEAIELNRLHRPPARHPPPSLIARVNSRSFSLELERDLTPGGPAGELVEDRSALAAFLAAAVPGSEWIVKAEHGNSGLANRRLRAPGLSAADGRFLSGLFAEDDRAVIEPWLQRERDGSVIFDAPFDPASLRIHETIGTTDGALIGALFVADGSEESPWARELSRMAERVASRLTDEGYFGPVCVDAFSWRDGRSLRLRPLVDLNCRLSMSDPAYRLWRRVAADRSLYYRFFNRRKISLPPDLSRALVALGDRRYDVARRRGVLLASPPRFSKVAVIFIAENRQEIVALERDFRARFEV
jgi:hypothetical protein